MDEFITKYEKDIIGVLSGWDRLVLRGTYRMLCFVEGMMRYLSQASVLLRDFNDHAKAMTAMLLEASYERARRLERPLVYLPSSNEDKEKRARRLLEEQPTESGLVCILSSVEPCVTYEVHRNREKKKLELKRKNGKCLYLYHYFLDPQFGWMNARIQTWFPFSMQICLNGREWLARKMDRVGLAYESYDNCFPWIADFDKAQRLMDGLLNLNWPKLLDAVARRVNPAMDKMFESSPKPYYWSGYQSEWATDIAFGSQQALASIYPQLVWGGITNFSCSDVMRFLGRRYNGRFSKEVVSDFKDRVEGIRLRHTANGNSLKLYDKGPNILRSETTINNPGDLKVYRASEDHPEGPKSWQAMRKGVADLYRRAERSQKANERYLNALAGLDTSTRLQDLFASVSRASKWKGKAIRPLRVWTSEDQALLEAISRPEFLLGGFRNRDLAALLYPKAQDTLESKKRAAARISYRLKVLRGHSLIAKLPNTNRYRITQKGREIATAAITSQKVTVQQLANAAA